MCGPLSQVGYQSGPGGCGGGMLHTPIAFIAPCCMPPPDPTTTPSPDQDWTHRPSQGIVINQGCCFINLTIPHTRLVACPSGTPPVYSALSELPALKHTLVDLEDWGPTFIAVWTVAMALALAGGWAVRVRRWWAGSGQVVMEAVRGSGMLAAWQREQLHQGPVALPQPTTPAWLCSCGLAPGDGQTRQRVSSKPLHSPSVCRAPTQR